MSAGEDGGLVVRTAGPEETEAAAATIAQTLRGGEIILLTGGIGSGKTVFAKGVARELGVEEPVVSPSFLLHLVYEGRLTLNHFDLYRLESGTEAAELAIEEAADGDAVTLVEWGDRFADVVRPPFLRVAFELGEGDEDRVLTVSAAGAEWEERLPALEAGLERFA